MQLTVALVLAAPLHLAGAQEARLPEVNQVNAAELVPHRLRLDLGDFLADVFDTPEVYISLERTHYYVDGGPRPAFRVRWVANTHPHEDEVLLDEERLSVVQVETLSSGIRDSGRVMAFVRDDSITSVRLSSTGETSSVTVPWSDEGAYHLMMLPYWFAALDAKPGETFTLPAFAASSGDRSVIEVEVIGPVPDEGTGNSDVWRFQSDHGWVEIEWDIDRATAPYLRRMIWRYKGGSLDGQSSDQRVVEWALFTGDTFRGVVRP